MGRTAMASAPRAPRSARWSVVQVCGPPDATATLEDLHSAELTAGCLSAGGWSLRRGRRL
jgi:hypothetical protein